MCLVDRADVYIHTFSDFLTFCRLGWWSELLRLDIGHVSYQSKFLTKVVLLDSSNFICFVWYLLSGVKGCELWLHQAVNTTSWNLCFHSQVLFVIISTVFVARLSIVKGSVRGARPVKENDLYSWPSSYKSSVLRSCFEVIVLLYLPSSYQYLISTVDG